jgi:hypothetical protein
LVAELTAAHRSSLVPYIESFKEFLQTKKGGEWLKDRDDRHKLFTEKLALEKLDTLSIEDFSIPVKMLWAFAGWSARGKEWLLAQMLSEGGIERVRSELKRFLYGKGDIARRYDDFDIRILKGTAAKTEMLNVMFPGKYGIWNDRVRQALKFLNLSNLFPDRVFRTQIEGNDYVACNSTLGSLGSELRSHGLSHVSFFEVDLFLYSVFVDFAAKKGTLEELPEEEIDEVPPSISRETDLRDYLANNPQRLEKGLKLVGKEYATDIGSIDLLCEDPKGKLVVVETKKGRESDRVVGQILRYMGWLGKHMERKVRGIIVVSEPNERLEYALHATRDVQLKFYKVKFEIADSFD